MLRDMNRRRLNQAFDWFGVGSSVFVLLFSIAVFVAILFGLDH